MKLVTFPRQKNGQEIFYLSKSESSKSKGSLVLRDDTTLYVVFYIKAKINLINKRNKRIFIFYNLPKI
jgi:hypothetical protein